jgi:hypothetical protein
MRSIEIINAMNRDPLEGCPSASQVVVKYGKKLVGKRVLTDREGEYPGGIAVITGLMDDDENIVCYARNEWTDAHEFDKQGIGIFHYERLKVLDDKKKIAIKRKK